MRYRLLGPLEVTANDGKPVEIAAPRRRALLAFLLLHEGEPVSIDSIAVGLWGDEPPPAAISSVQAHVSRLRDELGPGVIETTRPGYRLRLGADDLDVTTFDRLVAEGREGLRHGRWALAEAAFRRGLDLWCGPPLADVANEPFAAREIRRLEELRLAAHEGAVDAGLRLGRHAQLISELEDLVEREPHREPLWRRLILALYQVGRQADALAAYRSLRSRLVNELGIEPSPEIQALELAILRQDPDLAGPPLGPSQPEIHLPMPLGELLGRDADIEAISALVGRQRLVTLVGTGGIGKTRLAIEVGHRLVPEFPEGVLFVDLSAVRDSSLVLSTIGQATGGDRRPWEVILDRRLLLILDNLEQVLGAAQDIAELVQRCPDLCVIVTSRAPLRVRGERLHDVAPLDRGAATSLFELRAREALAAWTSAPGIVDRIVDRLEGLPLAIELTAARVRAVAPEVLPERLERPLAVMARGARDAPPRQRALRDTIAWSYDLLSPTARSVYRLMSVFAGGCDLDAATAVAGAGVEVLAELLDHSLLQRSAERYLMLETIRQFGAEEATAEGEVEAARDRHLAHFVRVMQRVKRAAAAADERDAWIATCTRERDNLRVAFDHALRTQDREAAIELLRGASVYWLIVGAPDEGERWATAVLSMIGPEDPRRARAIANLAEYPRWRGDHQRAIMLRREGVELARRSRDEEMLATLLDDLASSLGALGRFPEAEAALNGAGTVRETTPDDHLGRAHTLSSWAELRLRQGDGAVALELARKSRKIAAEADAPSGWSLEDDELEAHALLGCGRFAEAAALYRGLLPGAFALDFRIAMLAGLVGLAATLVDSEPAGSALTLGMAERVRSESQLGYWDPREVEAIEAGLLDRLGAEELARLRAAGRGTPIPGMLAAAGLVEAPFAAPSGDP